MRPAGGLVDWQQCVPPRVWLTCIDVLDRIAPVFSFGGSVSWEAWTALSYDSQLTCPPVLTCTALVDALPCGSAGTL